VCWPGAAGSARNADSVRFAEVGLGLCLERRSARSALPKRWAGTTAVACARWFPNYLEADCRLRGAAALAAARVLGASPV